MTNQPDRGDRNERNRTIIEQFRSNGGRVGGNFEGRPVLLLGTTGARTGLPRLNPLMYLADGDRWLVFATKGGNPKHPDWYHNLVANPAVTIEVGTETIQAHAEVIAGEERDRLYAIQAERYPQFGEYERRTSRIIPVIAISRAEA